MHERVRHSLPALCLVLAGCLGGENEAPTIVAPPAEARLVPGSYIGDYTHIPDSLRQGFGGRTDSERRWNLPQSVGARLPGRL